MGVPGPWASCGWAATQLGDGAGDIATLSSPLEAELPVQKTIKRAEMMAVWHVLKRCVPPVTIWTDHKPIVDGILKGRAWCTAADRAHADVWRRIWDALEDVGLGSDGATIRHTKAHRTMEAIRGLPRDERRIAHGNRRVDEAAKQAARRDDQRGMAEARHGTLELVAGRVRGALEYLAELYVEADGFGDTGDIVKTCGRPKARQARQPERPHQLVPRAGGWVRCLACGGTARSTKGRKALKRGECAGPAVLRIGRVHASGQQVRPEGHVLWRTGPYFWCYKCAGHSQGKRLVLLGRPCKGKLAGNYGARVRARLLEGRHPVTKDWIGEARPVSLGEWRALVEAGATRDGARWGWSVPGGWRGGLGRGARGLGCRAGARGRSLGFVLLLLLGPCVGYPAA